MKINKRYFLMRIVSFPLKLIFSIIWYLLVALLTSLKWLINGSQEVTYGNDHGKSIVKLIEQNKQLIKILQK